MGAGAVAGDDDRVGRQVDLQRLVEGDRRGVGPWPTARAARREHRAAGFGIRHQGFAQRDVELDGSRVGGARSGGGRQHPAGGRAPGGVVRVQPLGGVLGEAQADGGPNLGAEVAQLLHGLVGPGAQEFVGPVGRQHDQRHPRVVGLHHGRAQVGHGRAGRHGDAHRRAGCDRQADGQVAGGAFVDADVQPDPARPVGVLQREGERRVPRTRAQHHVADAAANQLVNDHASLGRRGVHSYRVSQPARHTPSVELLGQIAAISPHKSTLGAYLGSARAPTSARPGT